MLISINAGHTKQGQKGAGATYDGWYEGDITRAVANELGTLLRAKGHKTHSSAVDKASSQNAYLKKVCDMANSSGADLFISLHTNASSSHKANGVEVFTWKGQKHKEAVGICSNLEDLGFRNRGVKDGSKLYVIKNTKPKALLVELFFIDNSIDRRLYIQFGVRRIAEAIANAI